MRAEVAGHHYILDDERHIVFRRRSESDRVATDGTTTCEIIDVLIHRIKTLNNLHPCDENVRTVALLRMAKEEQKDRKKRVEAETHASQ